MAGPGSHDESGSSDSEAELEVSMEDGALIMQLESELASNPADYDRHVQLIAVLRRCKMGERLRETRQAMHARFPLGEGLWLDWLSDELEAAAGPEDIASLRALFELAVEDYLSVAIWAQYLE